MAKIKAKRSGACADCGRAFPEGAQIRWFPKIGSLCADKAGCEQVARNVAAFERDQRERRAAESAPAYVAARDARQTPMTRERTPIACPLCHAPIKAASGRCIPCGTRGASWNGERESVLAVCGTCHALHWQAVGEPCAMPPPVAYGSAWGASANAPASFAATVAETLATPAGTPFPSTVRDTFAQFADGIEAARLMFASLA